MNTILVKLGVRSSTVGLATRLAKADIIGAALQREWDANGHKSPCSCVAEHDEPRMLVSGARY